ncbi:hypothetical protein H2248_003876 [Termitomyces sp. 'cryptogamus']|nr:hypothetical protein H2248_003876 [Termitomyces sp. 'cryptogamus']
MVANAGICRAHLITESLYIRFVSARIESSMRTSGGRRMGKTFRSECTRCLLVLQVCSIADDQARPRWKDYRSVFSGRKTRQYLPSSLINAASDPKFVGEASLGAYSATKFAVRGLTQAAATEWGRHGITVNAYCPGIIQTDIIQDIADGTKMLLDDVYTKFGAQSAVGRNGTVEDVANVVSFLASKDARLITGQGVAVDGGMQYS